MVLSQLRAIIDCDWPQGGYKGHLKKVLARPSQKYNQMGIPDKQHGDSNARLVYISQDNGAGGSNPQRISKKWAVWDQVGGRTEHEKRSNPI